MQSVLAAADVDGGFRVVTDADGHIRIDADEFDAELLPLREVVPQQGSAEIAEVVRRPIGCEVGLPAGAQSRELGEPFLVGWVDVELPGHAVDGAPGQGLLHPVAGLAEHERPDREARIRARGDVVLVEEDGVLSFEPCAGDDLNELESQGHGRVRVRSRLGEWGEGITPIGGECGGGRSIFRHGDILSPLTVVSRRPVVLVSAIFV